MKNKRYRGRKKQKNGEKSGGIRGRNRENKKV